MLTLRMGLYDWQGDFRSVPEVCSFPETTLQDASPLSLHHLQSFASSRDAKLWADFRQALLAK